MKKELPLTDAQEKIQAGVFRQSAQDSKKLDHPIFSMSLPAVLSPREFLFLQIKPVWVPYFVLCSFPFSYRWLLHEHYLHMTAGI